jgi:hypothetical protein
MAKYNGAILVVDEQRRRESIQEHIQESGKYIEALSAPDWPIREKSILFVSLDGTMIQYAALATRGQRVATDKSRIVLSDFVEIRPPIPFEDIKAILTHRLEMYFIRSSSGLGSYLSPETYKETISIIKKLRPYIEENLIKLEQATVIEIKHGHSWQIFNQERDAVNISLRIFNPIEDNSPLFRTPPDVNPTHFLSQIQFSKLNEDQIINNDAQVFGNWQRLGQYNNGQVVFHSRDERLTVINANRTAIEKILGVDLIYYHGRYKSYVMVQYKRLETENGIRLYRPDSDSNYSRELQRMKAVNLASVKGKVPSITAPDDYRLNLGPFYLKLCHADLFDSSSAGMITGWYFPLDYWDTLLNSKYAYGPRGGRYVSQYNAMRYFSNTMFISLVQDGWIGTSLAKQEVEDLIIHSLENQKSIILASHQIENPDTEL